MLEVAAGGWPPGKSRLGVDCVQDSREISPLSFPLESYQDRGAHISVDDMVVVGKRDKI